MIELSPKMQFLANPERAKKFNELIAEPVMREAITNSLAELGWGPLDPKELLGAQKFILIFCSIAEPPKTGGSLPQKTLKEV